MGFSGLWFLCSSFYCILDTGAAFMPRTGSIPKQKIEGRDSDGRVTGAECWRKPVDTLSLSRDPGVKMSHRVSVEVGKHGQQDLNC